MKQVIQQLKDGKTVIEEVPAPAKRENGAIVRNAYSLVSTGTERMLLELAGGSLLAKARKRPDLVRQVFQNLKTAGWQATYLKVKSKLARPVPLGYSAAGVVVEPCDGETSLQAGERLACAGLGFAGHAEEIYVPRNLCARVPEKVSLQSAAFTTVGAIALQGVRVARAQLGERVLVIGLGLVGQLTVQILAAAGCQVVGFDIDPWRVDLARAHGIAAVADASEIESAGRGAGSRFRGFDVVMITAAAESNEPIEMAGALARDKGVVVVVGAVKMEVPRKVYYEKELELRLSRSYGPGRYDPIYEERGVDYPYGYVRWTEQRNMEAFLGLLAENKVCVERLITHIFPIEEALAAYGLITSAASSPYLGILLDYHLSEATAPPLGGNGNPRVVPVSSARSRPNRAHITRPAERPVTIGFIGSGNFARAALLPNLRRLSNVRLKHVAAAGGLSAKSAAREFDFEYCTTDYATLLSDKEVDALFIATRHNLHAPLVMAALKSGRPVFVEKPLCLNEAELLGIIEAWRAAPTAHVMVGFNRRFSRFTQDMLDFFSSCRAPRVINYRVNAGALPPDNWLQLPEEGGGRIVGEACHFLDFMTLMSGALPIQVFATALPADGGPRDNVVITVNFRNGSIGSLQYLANGDPLLPKERVEVFCQGSVAVLEDFKRLTLLRNGKRKVIRRLAQDKGHYHEVRAFIDAVRQGLGSPVDFGESALATRATFMAMASLQSGTTATVAPVVLG
ncbi:MAG: bi-domain-containing oxidoreductase [Acidobacteria bacterium]|nr:bi-domain-containing oxidoreductase [Acidobacteriota bacterium]